MDLKLSFSTISIFFIKTVFWKSYCQHKGPSNECPDDGLVTDHVTFHPNTKVNDLNDSECYIHFRNYILNYYIHVRNTDISNAHLYIQTTIKRWNYFCMASS